MRSIVAAVVLGALGGSACGPANGTDARAARGTWAVPALGLVLYQPSFRELSALDAATGEERWRFRRTLDPDPPYARLYPPQLTCPPAVTPSGKLVLRYIEALYAVDPGTGQTLWTQNLSPPALCPAVTPDSGVVVVVGRRKALAKFDGHGKLAWRVDLPHDGIALASPDVLLPSGDVVVRTRTHVLSLSPEGGLNWARPTPAFADGQGPE